MWTAHSTLPSFRRHVDPSIHSQCSLMAKSCWVDDLFQDGSLVRRSIARLNINGSLDTDFTPEINGVVRAVAVQADGKMLLGGQFTQVAGEPHRNIVRLNADGSLDTDFNASANPHVRALALQSDGKILMGGAFTQVNGQATALLCCPARR